LDVASFADFVVAQLQASIFTSSPTFRVGPALSLFMSKWPERFQTVVFASEAANTFSSGTPLLILQSRDARFRLQAGPSRLDIVQSARDNIDVSEHFSMCCDVFENYLQVFPSLVSRASCLVRSVATEAKPAAALARHFLKGVWLEGDANIETADDLEMNIGISYIKNDSMQFAGWFKCRSGSFFRGGATPNPSQSSPVIIVDQDLNTPFAESKAAFGMQEVRTFFSMAPHDLAARLAMYFP
jgi:hypothetical protein